MLWLPQAGEGCVCACFSLVLVAGIMLACQNESTTDTHWLEELTDSDHGYPVFLWAV